MNDCGTTKCATQMAFHELLERAKGIKDQARNLRIDVDERVDALVGVAAKPPLCSDKPVDKPPLYEQMILLFNETQESLSEIKTQIGRL